MCLSLELYETLLCHEIVIRLLNSPDVGSAIAGGLFMVEDEESAPSSRMSDSTQTRTRTKFRTPFILRLLFSLCQFAAVFTSSLKIQTHNLNLAIVLTPEKNATPIFLTLISKR